MFLMIAAYIQEEIDEAGDEGVPEHPPTLQLFKKQVDSYESIYGQVEKFDVSISVIFIHGMFKIFVLLSGYQGDRVMVPC